jgi:(2R)-sulfolactate sulfo-lyase subunit alpha
MVESMSGVTPKFVVHDKNDNVGVAVEDLRAGEEVVGVYLSDGSLITVKVLSDIPLGHKVALTDLRVGDKVVKYGEVIGVVTKDVRKGEHVHIHNIRSLRW